MDMSRLEPHKVTLRMNYIGNECYSDEYRETQPHKGLQHIANALATLAERQDGDPDPAATTAQAHLLLLNAAAWAEAWSSGYGGDTLLEPALIQVFDILWAAGEHPYYDTVEEALEELDLNGDAPPESTPTTKPDDFVLEFTADADDDGADEDAWAEPDENYNRRGDYVG